METDRGWRALPLGLQGCQVHEAGVHDEQDALSGKYEQSSSRTMIDDNMVCSKVGEVTMCYRGSIASLISFKDETEQHQRLEHLHCLVHPQ
eukprot:13106305-Heterocapsa_arctica.AAC.1